MAVAGAILVAMIFGVGALLLVYNVVCKILSLRDHRARSVMMAKPTALAIAAEAIPPHVIPWWAAVIVGVLDVPVTLAFILWQRRLTAAA